MTAFLFTGLGWSCWGLGLTVTMGFLLWLGALLMALARLWVFFGCKVKSLVSLEFTKLLELLICLILWASSLLMWTRDR